MINILNSATKMIKYKKISRANNSRFYKYEDFRDKIFLVFANP